MLQSALANRSISTWNYSLSSSQDSATKDDREMSSHTQTAVSEAPTAESSEPMLTELQRVEVGERRSL